MSPGDIVIVDWRDALHATEPNKRRPGIVVSSPSYFGSGLLFEIVVPLTGQKDLAVSGASSFIAPSTHNGCTKPCYALSWSVQSVAHARLTETGSYVSADDLREIRTQIARCVAAPALR